MGLKIRLARAGAKKRPYYHIVIADSRSPRDGRFIERVGSYNPMLPAEHADRVKLVAERLEHWIGNGAVATERVAKFLGKTLAYTYEFVEVLPEERVTMRTAQGPFPMATTYAWSAPTPGSTRMTLRNQGDPAGFSKLMAPYVSGAVRRANRKDLARLKKVLEAS